MLGLGLELQLLLELGSELGLGLEIEFIFRIWIRLGITDLDLTDQNGKKQYQFDF